MNGFSGYEWLGIAASILVMGMSRGGLPVSGIALPLMVLLWPEQGQAARSAVSFMLPLLCIMDLFGVFLFRGKPDWRHLRALMPATITGVAVASLFFVSDRGISVSDQHLKLVIGLLGLAFTAWHLWGGKLRQTGDARAAGRRWRPVVYGFSGGLTSTIAHAAGPVMQMYFLPTGLAKMPFAATTVYYFLFLNLIKLLPFAAFGRFSSEQLKADLLMLPVIPVGVLAGYGLVKVMRERFYSRFIHLTLCLTSALLVYRALTGR